MEQAVMQLSNRAAAEPSRYLPSLQAFKKILANKYKHADISLAGSGLQRIITTLNATPQQSTGTPANKLSQQYFRNLNKRNDWVECYRNRCKYPAAFFSFMERIYQEKQSKINPAIIGNGDCTLCICLYGIAHSF